MLTNTAIHPRLSTLFASLLKGKAHLFLTKRQSVSNSQQMMMTNNTQPPVLSFSPVPTITTIPISVARNPSPTPPPVSP
jgi:hypothetical protein